MIALTGSEFFAALRDAQFFLDEVCLEMWFFRKHRIALSTAKSFSSR